LEKELEGKASQLQTLGGVASAKQALEQKLQQELQSKSSLETAVARLESELANSQRDARSLEEKLLAAREESSRLRLDLSHLRPQIEAEVAKQKALVETERAEIERQKELWQGRLSQLEEHLHQAEQQARQEREKKEELESLLHEKMNSLQTAQGEAHRFKERALLAETDRKSMEEQADRLRQEMNRRDDEVRARYESQLVQARNTESATEEKNHELARRNDVLEDGLKKLEEESRRWKQEMEAQAEERKVAEDRLKWMQDGLAGQEKAFRDQVEKEFRERVERTEKEHQQWAEELLKSTEQKVHEQEAKAKQRIEALQASVGKDLEELEKRVYDLQREKDVLLEEKDLLRASLADLEKAFGQAKIQWAEERRAIEEQARAREKTASEDAAARWEERLKALEAKTADERQTWNDRVRAMEQDLNRFHEEKAQGQRLRQEEIIALQKQHELEMERLREARVPREPQGLIRGFLSWLNRPVIEVQIGSQHHRK
ncbi:MAG: hypothetical protein HY548_08780, partial [Elusimicrobia bacterium]|nr:hypothetical protein [Elusimicrobiota bacterium]